MSILHKVNITHRFTQERHFDHVREFCPFEINLLNALENVSKKAPNEGTLNQITSTYWEFDYTDSQGRAVHMTLHMTDEELGDKYAEAATGRKLSPPRFK